MADALERLVNLALYLAYSPAPVSAEDVRARVDGYPPGQDEPTFRRMFERDKDDLRAAGFVIVSDAENTYRLDASATFATEIELTSAESATIRAVGSAFVEDESFPFSADLRLALAKLATDVACPSAPALSRLAEEDPERQGASAALLDRAIGARKHVEFDYTNADGEHKHHRVEPYGLLVRDGRWYVAGRDSDRDEVRLYAVSRMGEISVNESRPRSPDFDVPAGFDVRTFIALPFQYGPESFEAELRFDVSQAWRALALTAGAGEFRPCSDGSLEWTVEARSGERLMRWVVEHGPGLTIVSPAGLATSLRERIERVAALHG